MSTIRWAPRVPMDWLRHLYEQDAAGIVDDELIDKVGYRLYARSLDCILVSDAAIGRSYECPMCGAAAEVGAQRSLCCNRCGWSSDWESFHRSWRHMELGADTTFLHKFAGDWRRARSAKEKMAAINDVIHRWHHETKLAERGGVGRPLGVNLIEGSRKQVLAFLDDLTAGPAKDRWQAFYADVRVRTRR